MLNELDNIIFTQDLHKNTQVYWRDLYNGDPNCASISSFSLKLFLKEAFPNRPFSQIRTLDVGCGRGRVVQKLRNFGVPAFGIDINLCTLSQCYFDVRSYLFCMDALNMDILESFDFVINNSYAEVDVEDYPLLVNHLYSILSKNGILLIHFIPRERYRKEEALFYNRGKCPQTGKFMKLLLAKGFKNANTIKSLSETRRLYNNGNGKWLMLKKEEKFSV